MTPLAALPALPLHTAGPYVAAAYVVFVVVLLVYLGIMALRLVRNQRELVELRRELEARDAVEGSGELPLPEPADEASRV